MSLAKWSALLLLTWSAAVGAQTAAAGAAQAYPLRPVRLLVPAPPGGGTDLLGRMVAMKLAGTLRQQFIVDNRAGASGMIASEIVARADPDGQTLLICFTTHATNPGLFPKMSYDTARDFAAVAMVGMIPSVLVLHPSLPPQSVKEFIAYAKERPGKLIYGSAGSGSGTHLSTVLFSSMTGTSMIHVPYKGAAPAVLDLLAGQLNFMFGNMASVMPHVRGGRLRALAVTGAKRSATAPELPTIAETGLPGYEATAWFALFAPARTPAAIVKTLNGEVNALFTQSDVKERMLSLGADAHPMTPAELSRYVDAEIIKWGKLIKATGAKAD